jgi:Ca-activated chloride channel family protein
VPLQSIHIHADLVGPLATFTMTQTYVNTEPYPLETVFLFPMDVKVVLSKLKVRFTLSDGSTRDLETIVEERKKAEIKYEDAVSSGKTAVIGTYATRKTRDMVRVVIGNFPVEAKASL